MVAFQLFGSAFQMMGAVLRMRVLNVEICNRGQVLSIDFDVILSFVCCILQPLLKKKKKAVCWYLSGFYKHFIIQLKAEVAKEVASARRKQHLSSLQYYCALNALQYRKRIAIMEPMLGYARSQVCSSKQHSFVAKKGAVNYFSVQCDISFANGSLYMSEPDIAP